MPKKPTLGGTAVQEKKPDTSKPSSKKKAVERPILYEKKSAKLCEGDTALTQQQSKGLLGWYEVGGEDEYLFIDLYGKKIQCSNNANNRPFDRPNADSISQEILRGHWKCNGETGIIGKTGKVLSMQHRLIGHVLACQAWELDKDKYPFWTTEPTLETFINFGIDEDDKTVNTIDTGKVRTPAHIIFRSEYFSGMSKSTKLQCSRMTEHGVRLLWERMGVAEGFSIIRTPSEIMEFINNHKKLLACVRHIYEENGGKEAKISKYLSPGYSAALMFLMGCAASDPTKYLASDNPTQDLLDWSHFDKAETFWTLLAGQDKNLGALREARGLLHQGSETGGSRDELCAILIKAWNSYVEGTPITKETLALTYDVDEDDVKTLAERPTLGGVDIAPKDREDSEDAVEEELEPLAEGATDPEDAGETERKKGSKVWVKESNGQHWHGLLQWVYTDNKSKKKIAKVKVAKGFAGAGKVFEVPYLSIQDKEPK